MTKKTTEETKETPPNYLDFWNSVEETDPKFTKDVSYGAHKFTTIDAYYQIKNATEKFGMYGKDWGLVDTQYTHIEGTPLMHLSAHFAYPVDGKVYRFPISTAISFSDSKGRYDQDFAKKIETSLICKSLSRLGFNSDIYMAKFEDNVYREQMVKKFTDPSGNVILFEHTPEQQEEFHELLNQGGALAFFSFLATLPAGAWSSLNDTYGKGEVVKKKALAKRLEADGQAVFEQYLDQMQERVRSGDKVGLSELGEEVGEVAKGMLFNRLSNEDRQIAIEMYQEET